MKKTGIKIIRRDSIPERDKAPHESTPQSDRLERVNTVNNWIAERRENSRLESQLSADQRIAWRDEDDTPTPA
jgi:hypothetical protein